jgi:hypothetical protein
MQRSIFPTRRATLLALVIAVLAITWGFVGGAEPVSATAPGLQGPIFVALPGGGGIQRMNPDGTAKATVVATSVPLPARDGLPAATLRWPERPSVSSDGALLVFDAVVQRANEDFPNDLNRELFAYNIRDGVLTRLKPGQRATNARWRPDSVATNGVIAFSLGNALVGEDPSFTSSSLATAAVGGTRSLVMSRPVVWTPTAGFSVNNIDWAPDGKAIAYNSVQAQVRVDGHDANGKDLTKIVYVSTVRIHEPRVEGLRRTVMQGADRGDPVQAQQPLSFAPTGYRLLVKPTGRPLQIVLFDGSYQQSGATEVFGSTDADVEAVFAPSNTTGTPGDTILTRRGNGLYLLTSSATEGKIRGPIATGFHPFWTAYPVPAVAGVAVPQLPAVPGLQPELQPRDLLNSTATQACRGLAALCTAPTVPAVTTIPGPQ